MAHTRGSGSLAMGLQDPCFLHIPCTIDHMPYTICSIPNHILLTSIGSICLCGLFGAPTVEVPGKGFGFNSGPYELRTIFLVRPKNVNLV